MGDEYDRAIWGAERELLEDLERIWDLVYGERLRGRKGKVAGRPLGTGDSTLKVSGAVILRGGLGRGE